MASARHNLTRRQVLGAGAAACALPLAAEQAAQAGAGGWATRSLPGRDPAQGATRSLPGRDPAERAGAASPACGREADAVAGQVPAPAPSAAARARWDRALGACRRAEAEVAGFQRQVDRMPTAARAFPACTPLDDRFDDLECARLDALRRLLRAPAPDFAALALKIELIVDEQAWELSGAEPCLAALKADARRRLAGRS